MKNLRKHFVSRTRNATCLSIEHYMYLWNPSDFFHIRIWVVRSFANIFAEDICSVHDVIKRYYIGSKWNWKSVPTSLFCSNSLVKLLLCNIFHKWIIMKRIPSDYIKTSIIFSVQKDLDIVPKYSVTVLTFVAYHHANRNENSYMCQLSKHNEVLLIYI